MLTHVRYVMYTNKMVIIFFSLLFLNSVWATLPVICSEYNGYLYHVTGLKEEAGTNSQEHCKDIAERRGNSVSIVDAAEHAFVQSLVSEPSIIGLKKSGSGDWDGTCVNWDDSEPTTYFENSVTPVISGDCGVEPCFTILPDGSFHDELCSVSFPVVCKFIIPICNGIPGTLLESCGSNGVCNWHRVDPGVCECDFGYGGSKCELHAICGGKDFWDPTVCNDGRGQCHLANEDNPGDISIGFIQYGRCYCDKGWSGDNCETEHTCNGLKYYESGVCGDHGTCEEEDICVCEDGYKSSGGTCIPFDLDTETMGIYYENCESFDKKFYGGGPNIEAKRWYRDGDCVPTKLLNYEYRKFIFISPSKFAIAYFRENWSGPPCSYNSTDRTGVFVKTYEVPVDTCVNDVYWRYESENLFIDGIFGYQVTVFRKNDSCKGHVSMAWFTRDPTYCDNSQDGIEKTRCLSKTQIAVDSWNGDYLTGKANCMKNTPPDQVVITNISDSNHQCRIYYYFPGLYRNIICYDGMYYCSGVEGGSKYACSGRGDCISEDTCICDDGFFGDNCEVKYCDGVLSNDTNVCNGHGYCIETEWCLCEDPDYISTLAVNGNCIPRGAYENVNMDGTRYLDSSCTKLEPSGIFVDQRLIQPSPGSYHWMTFAERKIDLTCFEFNERKCTNFLFGHEYSYFQGVKTIPQCIPKYDSYNYYGNKQLSEVLSSDNNFLFIYKENSNCEDLLVVVGIYDNEGCFANSLLQTTLYVTFGNDDLIDSIDIYDGMWQYDNPCGDFVSNLATNSHIDTCRTDSGSGFQYNFKVAGGSMPGGSGGEEPTIYWCWNGYSNQAHTCSGHGTCIGTNNCQCDSGYSGRKCDVFRCDGILNSNENVCNGFGKCTALNTCRCNSGFSNTYCDTCDNTNCHGVGNCIVDSPHNYHCENCGSFGSGTYCEGCTVNGKSGLQEDNVCYVSYAGRKNLDWQGSRDYCKANFHPASDIPVLSSEGHWNAFRTVTGKRSAWILLSNGEGGSWQWKDGGVTAYPGTYTNWKPKMPDSKGGCAYVHRKEGKHGGKWMNHYCASKKATEAVTCSLDLSDEAMTYSSNEFLNIGYTKYDFSRGWCDWTTALNCPDSYQECYGIKQGTFGVCSDEGTCEFDPIKKKNYCTCNSTRMGRECEYDNTDVSGKACTKLNGYCYLHYKIGKKGLPWNDAREHCKSDWDAAADLVVISNWEVQELVSSWVGDEKAWIGALDYVEGTWEWVDHSAMSYEKWFKKDEGHKPIGEDCAAMYSKKVAKSGWITSNCNIRMHFICGLKMTDAGVGASSSEWVNVNYHNLNSGSASCTCSNVPCPAQCL